MLELINRQVDRLAHASFKAGGRSVSPFHIWSAAGLVLAIAIALSFTVHAGLSSALVLLLVAINLVAAFVLGLTVKVVTGIERHTHYHYEIAIAVVTIATLKSLGQPIVPYLDAMAAGKGLLLASGRLGCFMVGCCHGRPFPFGVCYGPAQTRRYAGVRLFPVQLVESLLGVVLTTLCAYLLLRGARPGTALATYVIGYGTARFLIELLRGDPQRPYFRSYSEAQWIALLLMSFVVVLEYISVLPLHMSHVMLVTGVVAAMLTIAITRRVRQTPPELFTRIINP